MRRVASKSEWFAFVIFAILSAFFLRGWSRDIGPEPAHASAASKGMLIYPSRQSTSDLAVSGMIRGLPAGAIGYVRYADLASLPQVTVEVLNDENFRQVQAGRGVRVTGIYLEVLARSLGALPASDLIDATCLDDYRGHYPASYIAQHHPILALTINHQPIADWSKTSHRRDPGPYFITHANFVPAFKVLSHADRPQVPSGVIRINFSTIAETYGAIAPRGFAPGSIQEQGFTIARQNCFRCHNQGQYGGTKAGRSWTTLSTWAREQPAYFENYVHDPKAFEPHAKMPGNPGYDHATLEALDAYFRTFTETSSPNAETQNH